MSEIDKVIAEAENILAHAESTPFTPTVLLTMVLSLAKEIKKNEHAASSTGKAAQKSLKRARAGAEPEGHTGDAG